MLGSISFLFEQRGRVDGFYLGHAYPSSRLAIFPTLFPICPALDASGPVGRGQSSGRSAPRSNGRFLDPQPVARRGGHARLYDVRDHAKAMRHIQNWADESCVVHWAQESTESPSWPELSRRMKAEGRTTKLRHPSQAHENFELPELP